jgi:hypothetical protein
MLAGAGFSDSVYPETSITIVDAQIYFTPTAGDYAVGYMNGEGKDGIRVNVTTDNPTGTILYIKCDDASPEIALADLLIKTASNGAIITSYAAITDSDQALWSRPVPLTDFPVKTDVQIESIWNYSDAAGGGTTDYTNTITFTIVEQ